MDQKDLINSLPGSLKAKSKKIDSDKSSIIPQFGRLVSRPSTYWFWYYATRQALLHDIKPCAVTRGVELEQNDPLSNQWHHLPSFWSRCRRRQEPLAEPSPIVNISMNKSAPVHVPPAVSAYQRRHDTSVHFLSVHSRVCRRGPWIYVTGLEYDDITALGKAANEHPQGEGEGSIPGHRDHTGQSAEAKQVVNMEIKCI